jgi:hypothetical protein
VKPRTATPGPEPAPRPRSGEFEPDEEGTSFIRIAHSSLRRASRRRLLGVALSGGGIRSATFNLGVLQALAHLNLLRRVDYLSTVSGGGYIASWLYAWIARLPTGVQGVQARLDPFLSPLPYDETVHPIRFLREYSNYLTPRLGLLGADTWTMIAVWVRNAVLNQLVIVTFFAGVLTAPRALGWLTYVPDRMLSAIAFVCFVFGCGWLGFNLRQLDRRRPNGFDQGTVQRWIVLPILAGAAALAAIAAHLVSRDNSAPSSLAAIAFIVLTAGLVMMQATGGFGRCFWAARTSRTSAVANAVGIALAAIVAAAAGAGVVWTLGQWVAPAVRTAALEGDRWRWDAVAFGTPLVVATFAITGIVNIGMLGRGFPDERREWASRLGAWLAIYSLMWTALFVVAIYAPLWVALVGARLASVGAVTWVLSTVVGVLTGRSQKTGPLRLATVPTRMLRWIAAAALYVFIAGLLVAVSIGVHLLLARLAYGADPAATLTWIRTGYWTFVDPAAIWSALALSGALAGAAFLLAWRIDINEFSMHHFYKNRLVRCYLGASRAATRDPNPFTGFDPFDDLKLASLREHRPAVPAPGADPQYPYVGPYPIVNVALNLVKGENLAWQERKAESFVFTPYYAGFANLTGGGEPTPDYVSAKGYRPTLQYAYEGEQGVALGTATAVSGAAANPNMGYQSSPAGGFLMTVFNARLGWWMGNPRRQWKWRVSSPRNGLLYLLAELFGLTNDRSAFVNLSDGGHFENLGIYELVRRRCRYIVCCDAEQDEKVTFRGLGNAIRKCRMDLGVHISIDLRAVRPRRNGFSRIHYAVGNIRYPVGPPGRLVYLKSTLVADDPSDVLEYRSRHAEFPHETTANQWFTESQFESYRALGFHVALSAFREPALGGPLMSEGDLARLFAEVEGRWRRNAASSVPS